MEKMSMREFYAEVIANESVKAEVREFAQEQVAKLDARNAARREKNSAKAGERQVFVDAFVDALDAEAYLSASDIVVKMIAAGVERPDGKDINAQWVSSLAKAELASAEPRVERKEKAVKVSGKGAKVGYRLAQ